MNWLEEALKLKKDQWPNGETIWLAQVRDKTCDEKHRTQGVYVASVGYAQSVRMYCTRRTDLPTERPVYVDLWFVGPARVGWVDNPTRERQYQHFLSANRFQLGKIEALLEKYCGTSAAIQE